METSTPVPPPPPPSTPVVGGPDQSRRTARPGQLTPSWRLVTGATWVMVFVAFTGIWKVSRELGLATWWLGPISEPQPLVVMLAPFAAPMAMVAATLYDARRLPWFGLTASVVCAAVAVADLDRVRRLAYVELAIAAAAGLVSIASFGGSYRSVLRDRPDPADPEGRKPG